MSDDPYHTEFVSCPILSGKFHYFFFIIGNPSLRMVMVNSWKAARWHSTLYLTFGQQFLSTVVYCHTRLRLEFSASWESGNFQLTRWIHWVALWSSLDHPPHAHPPTAKLFLSMLCGVPTLFPSSIRDVRCPPLPVYVFSVRCPPLFCNTWLCLGF